MDYFGVDKCPEFRFYYKAIFPTKNYLSFEVNNKYSLEDLLEFIKG